MQLADAGAGRRSQADRAGLAGQPGRACSAAPRRRSTSRRSRAARRCSRRSSTGSSNGPAHCYGDYAFHTMLLGKIVARDPAAARRGGAGRAPVASRSSRPTSRRRRKGRMVRFRRHLGGAEGAGEGRRHRGDPRRGQRHRHAHVREADPRGPHRLREHGRGAQHPVGGSVVQPGDPARRQYRGRGALHDAHLGGDRRRARSRRRAPRACRSTARPCTNT